MNAYPGMPSAPKVYDFGVSPKSNEIGSRSLPSEIKCDFHPALLKTSDPTGNSPFLLFIILYYKKYCKFLKYEKFEKLIYSASCSPIIEEPSGSILEYGLELYTNYFKSIVKLNFFKCFSYLMYGSTDK